MKFSTIIVFCFCFFSEIGQVRADWPKQAVYLVETEWKYEPVSVPEVEDCNEKENKLTQSVIGRLKSVQIIARQAKITTDSGQSLDFGKDPGCGFQIPPIDEFILIFESEATVIFQDTLSENSEDDNIINLLGLRKNKDGGLVLFFIHTYFAYTYNEVGQYRYKMCFSTWTTPVREQKTKEKVK
ncbi:MAG: hypothetical protein A2301_03550 [Candidatus Magasanikbacteria bacterium RIFOXYB2_FULL_40_13]|uniref:Uncharacterized protein n=1 Tax=Candidatus Magasanikbacteria bacterium RIFOXYB1_FULL_40_15 TaxID=1798697 RepID=A0A1F6NEW8_9BACT|nr:MAG: hypothetical protein A2373_02995 [Candidatus Magasanikbacteria bacterium RIFOXYB1_FULL_40_15]OGH86921.1 MAG: hypothetical protein A2301_03550 [Candidatus Magasanikbacteria bacterium RIFOXYB2_FULL_40_13]